MNDDTEPNELHEQLADLLATHHELENVEHMANLIAGFYNRLRETIDPYLTPDGEIHDVALEITREWMTYTLGDA